VIAKYAEGVEQLEAALAGLSESNLGLSRAEGKWSIRQIVHHIADAEDIWETAIKAALGNSGCRFDVNWYIPDNKCAEPLDYTNRPVADAVELFKAARRHIAVLVNYLPDDAWERHIIFVRDDLPEGKEFKVGEMLRFQTMHLDRHIKQIRKTREKHGV
jgi:uncharacterized damage-inducible protein DinB